MPITAPPLGPTPGLEITAPHGRALVAPAVAADRRATRPEFTVRRRRRPGDLVVRDNTGIPHRTQPYTETSRRLMHRTGLAGEEPVA